MLHRLPSTSAKNTITNIAAALFASIGLFHLVRIFKGWEAVIGGVAIPLWASWLVVFVAFYLAFKMYQMDRG
ncbi:MAG: hypothetical protein AAB805_01640 [Patescibacteria group bacterium]